MAYFCGLLGVEKWQLRHHNVDGLAVEGLQGKPKLPQKGTKAAKCGDRGRKCGQIGLKNESVDNLV